MIVWPVVYVQIADTAGLEHIENDAEGNQADQKTVKDGPHQPGPER